MRWLKQLTVVGLLAAAQTTAMAADRSDNYGLRGSLAPASYSRWDGFFIGGQVSYSNFNVDFANVAATSTLTTSNPTYGGFLGYNVQWDRLVVGFDAGYNYPSTLETSTVSGTTTSSLKLVDYATFRGRAGYAFGQFMPYAVLGAAVGRMNYATTVSGTVTASRDNAFSAGFVAGIGMDVALLPNVFLRGEYEYVTFSPVASIHSSLNTVRAGIGVRF